MFRCEHIQLEANQSQTTTAGEYDFPNYPRQEQVFLTWAIHCRNVGTISYLQFFTM